MGAGRQVLRREDRLRSAIAAGPTAVDANGADGWIRALALAPHPEGGWYRRIHTSSLHVACGGRTRPALTSILYLLRAGEIGRWHRVASDEAWHLCAGSPMELTRADPDFMRIETGRLGPPPDEPAIVVPAGYWQTASSTGEFTLCGCTVGPSFDFADFSLLADDDAARSRLAHCAPEWLACV